jgi:N-acetylglucosamine kinase-like BadF-type ATPase
MDSYVIGMDGGGTKTSVVITDFDKNIIESFTGGTINYNGSGKALVDTNLQHIFQAIQSNGYPFEKCSAICIGAAGISNPTVKIMLIDNINKAGIMCPVRIVSDVEAAFAGAFEEAHGIILIAGTGSICYGKDWQGNTYRSGGYGYLIDDAGSGYAIAREILAAVVQAQDGRIEPTCLTRLVFNYLKITTIEELMSYVYHTQRSKKEIAALSVLIKEACEHGDEKAINIVKQCATDLTDLAAPVIKQFKGDITLAVSGGVLLNNEIIFHEFCGQMKLRYPQVTITKPKQSAAYGAINLALDFLKQTKESEG